MNKAILIGIGLLALVNGNSNAKSKCKGNKYKLPDGATACEEDLASLGYVQYEGKWYHQSQFTPAGQYAGVDKNSSQWLGILTNMINTGISIAQYITPLVQPKLSNTVLSQISCASSDINRTAIITQAGICTSKYIQQIINNNLPAVQQPSGSIVSSMVKITADGIWDNNKIAALNTVFGAAAQTKTLNQLLNTKNVNIT